MSYDPPLGVMQLFPPGQPKEIYSISSPDVSIGNLIVGETYIEPVGACEVINHTNGEKAVIHFPGRSFFSSEKYGVKILIKDAEDQPRYEVTGKYTESLQVKDLTTNEVSELMKMPNRLP